MDSFYGGKQGISFIIRAKFNSIADMETAFADFDYKGVWYGEYCLIDTVNKNDADNGKVFRRTLNTTGDNYSGYAEYIGQFKGSSGSIPIIDLSNLEDTEEQFSNLTITGDESIDYKDDEGTWHHLSPEDTRSQVDLPIFESNSVSPSTIVFKPGSSYGVTASPQLKYNWYISNTITNSEQDEPFTSKMTLGLEIPYVDVEIASVTAIAPTASATVTQQTITNSFYKKYDLEIPAGVPGAYITNIREEDYPSETSYYGFNQIDWDVYPPELKDDSSPINLMDYKGKIWVCSIGYYDLSLENGILDNIFISKEIQPKYLSVYPQYYYCNFDWMDHIPNESDIESKLEDTYPNDFPPQESSLIITTYMLNGSSNQTVIYHMVQYNEEGTDWDLIPVGSLQKDSNICAGLYGDNEYLDDSVFPYSPHYVKLKIQNMTTSYTLKETWI